MSNFFDVTVLGANGFLGSSLCRAALSRGLRVLALDRFSRGPHLPFSNALVRKKVDLSDSGSRANLGISSPWIFDCLSDSNPLRSESMTSQEFERKVDERLALIDDVTGSGPSAYAFISSGGAVYGETPLVGIDEAKPLNPISKYGQVKKRIEEHILQRVSARREVVVFRVANLYGVRPRSDASQGLIQNVLESVIFARPVTIFGDGSMVRDYIHVEDGAEAILEATERRAWSACVNIGSGIGHSINEVFELVENITSRRIIRHYREVPEGFVQVSVLDVSQLRALHPSFSPRTLSEGIKETYERIVGKSA